MSSDVYISGCSNSHYSFFDSIDDVWTNQLGYDKVYNHAVCGSSNDYITRRALDFCSRNKPNLAIIQWTQIPRSETFGRPTSVSEVINEDHENEPKVNCLQAHTKENLKDYQWHQYFKPDFYASTPLGNWVETPEGKGFTIQEDATTSLFNLIKNAYILQNFFKQRGQNYLFVNGGDWLHSNQFGYGGDIGSWYPLEFIDNFNDGPITAIQPLSKQLNKDRWPNINIMKDPQDLANDNEHPGPNTHKYFAQEVKDYVDNRKF